MLIPARGTSQKILGGTQTFRGWQGSIHFKIHCRRAMITVKPRESERKEPRIHFDTRTYACFCNACLGTLGNWELTFYMSATIYGRRLLRGRAYSLGSRRKGRGASHEAAEVTRSSAVSYEFLSGTRLCLVYGRPPVPPLHVITSRTLYLTYNLHDDSRLGTVSMFYFI